ncbi:MAG: hypothetical protein ABIL68_16640 [bacterium]
MNPSRTSTIPKLPSEYRIYFWDVAWDVLNRNRKRFELFIVRRLVDKGNSDVIAWLKQFYDVDRIEKMIHIDWKDIEVYFKKIQMQLVEQYLSETNTSPIPIVEV